MLESFPLMQITPIYPETVSSKSSCLRGPYLRSERVHIDETALIHELLGRNSAPGLMIDVGAHTGTSCVPFLASGWRVLAFEPNPLNSKHLKNKVNACGPEVQSRFLLREVAVGNETKFDVPFYFSDVSSGISSLSAFHESHRELRRVDVLPLTVLLQDHPLSEIDFLKIDTEGHDLFVLRGFPWDRISPRIIECEFEDAKTCSLGYTWKTQCQFLIAMGYTVLVSEWHPIITYGIRHDWRALKAYPCELEQSTAWGNLLAFRNESDAQHIIDLFIDDSLKMKKMRTACKFVKDALNGEVHAHGDGFILATGPKNYIRRVFTGHFFPGSTVTADVSIVVSKPVRIRLDVIRHGSGTPEATGSMILLTPGENSLHASHKVKIYQPSFGIQITCLEPGPSVELQSLRVELHLTNSGSAVCPTHKVVEYQQHNTPSIPNRKLEEVDPQTSVYKSDSVTMEPGQLARSAYYLYQLSNPALPTDQQIAAAISVMASVPYTLSSLNKYDLSLLQKCIETVLGGHSLEDAQVLKPSLLKGQDVTIEGTYVQCAVIGRREIPVSVTTPVIELPPRMDFYIETEYSCSSSGTASILFLDDTTSEVLAEISCSEGSNLLARQDLSLRGQNPTPIRITLSVKPGCELRWFSSKINPRMREEAPTLKSEIQRVAKGLPASVEGKTIFVPPTREPLYPRDIDRLMSLKDKFRGQRIFIMGNGPSLNRTPLDLLEKEYVFAFNRVNLLFERIKWRPQFYTAFDVRVVPDNAEEFSNLDIEFKFFSARYKQLLKEKPNHYWYHTKGFYDGFDHCFDPTVPYSGFGGGGTIAIIGIELAYFMGFDPIYLIGTDVSYTVPNTVRQSGADIFGDGVKLELESTADDDQNHFDPRYFGKGKKWHNPNTRDMKIGFARAATYIKKRGRSLINATVGGQLNEIRRVDFTSLF